MGFVAKLIGANGSSRAPQTNSSKQSDSSTADGALDTLSTVIRTFGDKAFSLDDGIEPEVFRIQCTELACHVENCASVPSLGLDATAGGDRQWGHVRRFFSDRRQQEKEFVDNRMADYRDVVDDLVGGLRELGMRDSETAINVQRNLNSIEKAVATGVLPEIKATLSETIRNIAEGFARQKQQYESRIGELNQRMSSLRQDLASTREEMTRDALTGAFNRGAFDKAVIQSLNLNFILKQHVTLIFIDLDHFKAINDNYGHAAGDEVLRSIGDCLARTFIRKTDFVARFGGDEFAIILPDTTAANAATLLTRFLDALKEVPIPYAPDSSPVTCSAGYTEVVPGDSVEVLVTRVDKALYDAKRNGRNCYHFAAPPDAKSVNGEVANGS